MQQPKRLSTGLQLLRALAVGVIVVIIGLVFFKRGLKPMKSSDGITTLIAEGSDLCVSGQYDAGLPKLRQAITLAQNGHMQSAVADASWRLGEFLFNQLMERHAKPRHEAETVGRPYRIPKTEFSDIEAHLNKALEIDPAKFEALRLLGLVHCELGQYAKAIQLFEKAVRINEKFAPAYNDMGIAYFRLEQYELAREYFTRATDLDDTLAEAWLNLAILQGTDANEPTMADSYRKAVANFERFLSANTGTPAQQQLARARMQEITGKLATLKDAPK